MPPPAELRKRPQDGISWVQKVAAVELGFRAAPGCWGGMWIYIYIYIYIGGRSTSVELCGAYEGGGAPTPWALPPASWPPRGVLDFNSKSSGLRLFQEISL